MSYNILRYSTEHAAENLLNMGIVPFGSAVVASLLTRLCFVRAFEANR